MGLEERWNLLNGFAAEEDTKVLDLYVSELIRWNKSIRLIGPKTEEGAAVQVVDSLLPFKYAALEFPLLDIGSGAGLPAIPLAICRRDVSITCMEPDTKRASFLRHAARHLGLSNIKVVCAKAEEAFENIPELSHSFRSVTARAVSGIDTLLGWAHPYLAPGGRVVLGRGPEKIICPGGWSLEKHISYEGHSSLGKRSVAVFSNSSQ